MYLRRVGLRICLLQKSSERTGSYWFLGVATTYFHLPILDDKEDEAGPPFNPKPISWAQISEHPSPSSSHSQLLASSLSSSSLAPAKPRLERVAATVNEVLAKNDLYEILGISNQPTLDKIAIRRAYLSRSRACHPECVAHVLNDGVSLTFSVSANFLTTPRLRTRSKRCRWHMTCLVNLRRNVYMIQGSHHLHTTSFLPSQLATLKIPLEVLSSVYSTTSWMVTLKW